jgi:O-antigen/teichoic acid export membrane protein
MFDFGIGNGLRNHLVRTLAEKDEKASQRYISSAYISVGLISLILLIVGLTAIFIIDWNTFLKVGLDILRPSVLKTFIAIVFSGVIIHFFFLLVTSICYALQKTFLPGLFTLITQVILLAFILVPNSASLESKITQLSIAYTISYNVPILVATLVLFCGKLKRMKPRFKSFDGAAAKQIMQLGGWFFFIQLALIALNSSNEIYINLFYDSADVVQYNYYHKLFYMITVFSTLITQPIWSAITKAFYEKRYKWIKSVWKTIMIIAGVCVLGCAILAALYQPIANLWLGKGVLKVDLLTVASFAVFTAQGVVVNMANCFANGFGKLKTQAICTSLGAVLKLVTVFVLNIFMESWVAVIIATIIATMPLFVCQPIIIIRYINSLANIPIDSDEVDVLRDVKEDISKEK